MEVIIVGDSHTRIFKHYNLNHSLFNLIVIPRSSVTLFRVQRDGINELLNMDHQRHIQ